MAHADNCWGRGKGYSLSDNQTVENGTTPTTEEGQNRSMDGSEHTFMVGLPV